MSTKTVLLDRDGVINPLIVRDDEKTSPQHTDEFRTLPGVEEALEMLRHAGFQIVVVSNQPDVEKSWRALDRDRLAAIDELLRALGVDAVYNCTHGPRGSCDDHWYREGGDIVTCDCRKPQPGLIEQAAEEQEIDVPNSYVVGDSEADMVAAARYEGGQDPFCGKLFIGEDPSAAADRSFYNLRAAVDWIQERS